MSQRYKLDTITPHSFTIVYKVKGEKHRKYFSFYCRPLPGFSTKDMKRLFVLSVEEHTEDKELRAFLLAWWPGKEGN